jgi:hypothetical protein
VLCWVHPGKEAPIVRASPLIIILAALCILGCDYRAGTAPPPAAKAPATAPATAPAEDDPLRLVRPATTQSAMPVAMEIDGNDYDFPPVNMLLRQQNDEIVALLTTVDPPNATEPDYRGNTVYLEFPLQIPRTHTLAGATWEYQAPNADRDEDEIRGIYLQGRKFCLQPYAVHAQVVGDVSPVVLKLSGTFLMFDDQSEQARAVKLDTTITAAVKVEPTPR